MPPQDVDQLPDDPITAGPGAPRTARPAGGEEEDLPDDPITGVGKRPASPRDQPFRGRAQLTPEQQAAFERGQKYIREHEPLDLAGQVGEFGTTLVEDIKGAARGVRSAYQLAMDRPREIPGKALELGKALGRAQLEQFRKGGEALGRGDYSSAFGYNLAGLLPVIGPAAAEIGEEAGEQRFGRAAAHALELGGPEVARALKIGPLIKPVARAPEVEQAIQATEAAGVRTSLGQRLGSLRLQKIERNLQNFAGSEREATEFYLGQQEDLANRMHDLASRAAPATMTAEDTGLAIKNRLAQRVGRLKGAADQLYDNVRAQAALAKQTLQNGWTGPFGSRRILRKTFEAPVDIRQLKQGLRPVWNNFQAAFQQPARAAASPAYRAFEQLMNTKDWYMNALDFDRTLGAIKAMARDGNSPLLNTQSQRIAKIMIGEGEKRLAAALSRVSPSVQGQLARGRALVKAYHEIADFSDSLGDQPGPVYERLVRRGLGPLDALKTLQRFAPQELQQVGRTYLEGLIRKATEEGGFQRSAGVMQSWKDMAPEVKEVLFGPGQTQDIHDFLLAAKNLNPAEGSATAGRLAAFLPHVAVLSSLFTGHPVAAGGIFVAEHTAPRIMARMLFQPGTARLLTAAITQPAGSKAFFRTMTLLNARAIAAEQADDRDRRAAVEQGAPGRAAAEPQPGARPAAAAPVRPSALTPTGAPAEGQEAAPSRSPTRAPGTAAAALSPRAQAGRPAPSRPGARPDFTPVFQQVGRRAGVPPGLLSTIAYLESAGNPNAIGSQGERGLMQLMPATARALGVDPTDPQASVQGAAELLRHYMQKYRGDIASVLAAYNEGETAFDRHRQRGEPLPAITQRYVRNGLAILRRGAQLLAEVRQQPQ